MIIDDDYQPLISIGILTIFLFCVFIVTPYPQYQVFSNPLDSTQEYTSRLVWGGFGMLDLMACGFLILTSYVMSLQKLEKVKA